jgi:hypothetical protein
MTTQNDHSEKQSGSQLSAQVMANRLICMIDDIPVMKGQAAAIQRAHSMAVLLEQKLNTDRLPGLLDRVRRVVKALDTIAAGYDEDGCEFCGKNDQQKYTHFSDCIITELRALRAELEVTE